MSAPVFVLEPDVLAEAQAGATVVLAGAEGRHAASVVRLAPGERAVLVDGRGRRADAIVRDTTGRDQVSFDIEAIADEPEPPQSFVVAQALPKGDRGELAVEVMTEVGVDVIIPWSASRCVSVWRGDRAEKSLRKWQDAARAAAKQSRRARHPRVEPLASTTAVVARVRQAALALVLDEEAAAPIGSVELPDAGEVLLIVGPEGGISDDERHAFAQAGARAVRLGPTVLRTSTAGVVGLTALLAGSPRWERADDGHGRMAT